MSKKLIQDYLRNLLQRQALLQIKKYQHVKKVNSSLFEKLTSKTFAERQKNMLPSLISSNQTAYVNED